MDRRNRARRFGVLAGLVALPAFAADPPTPQTQLHDVQQQLDTAREENKSFSKEAAGFHADIVELQRSEVTAAKNVQATEAKLTETESTLDGLAKDEAAQSAEWQRRQQHEAEILGALERIATTPPALIVVAPGSPVDAARSGILLGAAVPALQQAAAAIAASLDTLRGTKAAIVAKKEDLQTQQRALDAERQQLDALLQQKHALETATQQKAAAAQQRATALVAKASDLQQAIDRADQARQERDRADKAEVDKAREDRAKATQQKDTGAIPVAVAAGPGPAGGHLTPPAAGQIIKRFGDEDGASPAKGISFATRVAARIVAPAAGEVLFSGPFKGYGQILIIDHGGGYHSLLAGLGKIDCVVGQKLTGGEPVGAMPEDGTPVLYLEVRRQNQPVDPAPWLGLREQKASG